MPVALRTLPLLVLALGCTGACKSAPPAVAAATSPAPQSPESAEHFPILIGAGDIADCRTDAHQRTAKLLDAAFANGREGFVFAAGDLAYDRGTPAEFEGCYGRSWGRHKARTRPAVGNHEYLTPGAAGYYGYWGAQAGDERQGWYAYSLGGWRIFVLNSNCDVVGCEAGSAQERWLREELKAHAGKCALAYWHHPRFSSGAHGDEPAMRDLFHALDEGGAELVLAGHDHHYERFAPQDADGRARVDGVRQFVVGTGGRAPYRIAEPVANSERRETGTFGVFELTLKPEGYAWRFVPVAGASFEDRGEADCH